MLSLRFQRVGRKKDYTFRVVVIDSRFSSRSGKVKEVLGWWDPKKDKYELKKEKIEYWLKNGAQPTDSCYNLLIKAKIINGKKKQIVFHKHKKDEAEDKTANNTKETKIEENNNTLNN
ncbi:MAG: 30S ribosomal protein S16 [Minisyncoccia bacterium]|jgi:small subunit ribosomal protein S16